MFHTVIVKGTSPSSGYSVMAAISAVVSSERWRRSATTHSSGCSTSTALIRPRVEASLARVLTVVVGRLISAFTRSKGLFDDNLLPVRREGPYPRPGPQASVTAPGGANLTAA